MSDSTKHQNVHTERIFVSAELAARWLKLNIENNRAIAENRVSQYARDMRSNKWRENGDTIKFAATGELIDGQHRLRACVQSGVGFWSQIAYGVQKDAFITIDRNQVRSTGQQLRMTHGLMDYNVSSAVLTWLWRFRDGIVITERTPTIMEAEELLERHPKIADSIHYVKRGFRRFKCGPGAAVAFCHYLFAKQDAELAELFFEALFSGVNLNASDPVFLLRERIISASANAKIRSSTHELIALYFKAWIAEKEGRKMKVLRWMPSETFPNIGLIEEGAVPMKTEPILNSKLAGKRKSKKNVAILRKDSQ